MPLLLRALEVVGNGTTCNNLLNAFLSAPTATPAARENVHVLEDNFRKGRFERAGAYRTRSFDDVTLTPDLIANYMTEIQARSSK